MTYRFAMALLILGTTLMIWDMGAVVALDPIGPDHEENPPSHHSPLRLAASIAACVLASALFERNARLTRGVT